MYPVRSIDPLKIPAEIREHLDFSVPIFSEQAGTRWMSGAWRLWHPCVPGPGICVDSFVFAWCAVYYVRVFCFAVFRRLSGKQQKHTTQHGQVVKGQRARGKAGTSTGVGIVS